MPSSGVLGHAGLHAGIIWILSLIAATRGAFLCSQFSAWLDEHNDAEALQSIKSAVEASPAEAKAAAVVPIILQLCTPS